MSLYIANTTTQDHIFSYWVAEQNKPFEELIRAGKQVSVYPRGTRHDHEAIVKQHVIYGIVAYNEIDRTKAFVGTCYRYDDPIPVDRLHHALEKNEDFAVQRSKTIRQENAASIESQLNATAESQNNRLNGIDVTIEEEGKDTQINETVVVEREGARRRGRPSRNG